MEWEALTSEGTAGAPITERLSRLRVPGGWVYRSLLINRGAPPLMAMVFVPDEPPRRGRPPKAAKGD